MTRLYIVEGLPCSGKSSTARFIADMLEHRGQTVLCVDEGTGTHPADYEFHALVDGKIIALNQLPQEQWADLMPQKIYDGLSWETESPLMLEKWRQFAKNADTETTYVFNCVLLQNPMCETMMRFGMSEEDSAAYIRQITKIIRPLEPVVVYLHSDEIAANIRRTAAERPGWLGSVIDYHIKGRYGQSIGAQGFDGYVACLEERQRREERILRSLPIKSVMLCNPHLDWESAHLELQKLL